MKRIAVKYEWKYDDIYLFIYEKSEKITEAV